MAPLVAAALISGGTAVAGFLYDFFTRRAASKMSKKASQKLTKSGKLELDTPEVKLLNNLSKDEQKIINSVLPYLSKNAEEFLNELPQLDMTQLQQIAQQAPEAPDVPGAKELGFPEIQDVTQDIRTETDFDPIEKQARRQFREETLPGIQEQFAGLGGGTRSSGFQGAAQAGGERLQESLDALRSKFGLKRGDLLGQLNIKQQALGQERAAKSGVLGSQRFELGQKGQQQQFGQQVDLANVGLAQTTQELQRRQQGLDTTGMLLNRRALTPIIPQQPIPSTAGAQIGAAGAEGFGTAIGKMDFSKLFEKKGT